MGKLFLTSVFSWKNMTQLVVPRVANVTNVNPVPPEIQVIWLV